MSRIWLAGASIALLGCAETLVPFAVDGGEGSSDSVDSSEQETESGSGGESTDDDSEVPRDTADSETERESDSVDTDSDVTSDDPQDSDPLGTLGDPCWKPVLTDRHPNAGMPDCDAGLRCVGDSDEAWCTEECGTTGSAATTDPIVGWCCGEVGSTCNPTRYYLPESMAAACVPRTLLLGAPCENGGGERCKSVCDGTTVVATAVCVQLESGGFCSFGCDGDEACTVQEAFAAGCCGAAMGGSYCLSERSESCLTAP